MPDRTVRLLAEMATAFRAENRPCGDQTADFLVSFSGLGPLSGEAKADTGPIRALLATSSFPLARTMLAAFDALPWGDNPVVTRVSRRVDSLYIVSNLVGPDGPLHCPTLRAGLYYQHPDTRLGLHSHAAAETYVIVAGRALWTAGDTHREVAPGDSIHHTTYLPHACRTGPEGVVAVWRWSGEIGIDSYRMHNGHDAFGTVAG